ncbi:MAG TPA: hypothetical protein VH110_05185 [Candidatus Acidoferrum sp.]|nr:hypothetical protein [Candidatus Acidoferrum sp.]
MSDAITYTETGGRVTVEMSRDDWEQLTRMLGYAAGAAQADNQWLFWQFIVFTNQLNRTNPHFRPYEIPEAYRQREAKP